MGFHPRKLRIIVSGGERLFRTTKFRPGPNGQGRGGNCFPPFFSPSSHLSLIVLRHFCGGKAVAILANVNYSLLMTSESFGTFFGADFWTNLLSRHPPKIFLCVQYVHHDTCIVDTSFLFHFTNVWCTLRAAIFFKARSLNLLRSNLMEIESTDLLGK